MLEVDKGQNGIFENILVFALFSISWMVHGSSEITSEENENGGKSAISSKSKNLVLNYHFHRQCNYHCKFCFHTAKTRSIASPDDAKAAMAFGMSVTILIHHIMGTSAILYRAAKMCEARLQGSVI